MRGATLMQPATPDRPRPTPNLIGCSRWVSMPTSCAPVGDCISARGESRAFAGMTKGRASRHTHAGFAAISAAVAFAFGHTTSNSPFCHWLTVPGMPTFSLPLNLMLPRIVLCSVPAT
jgi:hypothetical protein